MSVGVDLFVDRVAQRRHHGLGVHVGCALSFEVLEGFERCKI